MVITVAMSVLVVHMIVVERVEMVVVEVARIHVRIFVLVARVVVEDVRDVQAVQVAQLLVEQRVRSLVDHAQDAKTVAVILVVSAVPVAQELVILIVTGVLVA